MLVSADSARIFQVTVTWLSQYMPRLYRQTLYVYSMLVSAESAAYFMFVSADSASTFHVSIS